VGSQRVLRQELALKPGRWLTGELFAEYTFFEYQCLGKAFQAGEFYLLTHVSAAFPLQV
jgi:hypothetical protein